MEQKLCSIKAEDDCLYPTHLKCRIREEPPWVPPHEFWFPLHPPSKQIPSPLTPVSCLHTLLRSFQLPHATYPSNQDFSSITQHKLLLVTNLQAARPRELYFSPPITSKSSLLGETPSAFGCSNTTLGFPLSLSPDNGFPFSLDVPPKLYIFLFPDLIPKLFPFCPCSPSMDSNASDSLTTLTLIHF